MKYIGWKFVNMGWFVNEFPKYVFLVSKLIFKSLPVLFTFD